MLERAYRQSYSFDPRNSSITKARATPDLVAINVNAHYALQRVSQPAAGGGFTTSPPSTVPDIRSLFLGFYYNIAKLPEQPMRPRVADDRIGYFVQERFDYGNDTTLTPKVNLIQRWRLEKKDPAAALSEPKEPIVFWIDRNIPHQYRQAIIDGVLEWNKAFEKAGFKNALQAKIQPDDADFETLDTRHASIRWMPTARPIFGGVGPRQVDPRTGEILDADIGIDPVRLRNRRFIRVEQIRPQSRARSFMEHPERMCMLAGLRGAGTQLHLRPARSARRARSGRSRSRGIRAGRCQGNRHARSRARARACATIFVPRPSTRRRNSATPSSRASTASPDRSWSTTRSTSRCPENGRARTA